jgi:hypothetical protein
MYWKVPRIVPSCVRFWFPGERARPRSPDAIDHQRSGSDCARLVSRRLPDRRRSRAERRCRVRPRDGRRRRGGQRKRNPQVQREDRGDGLVPGWALPSRGSRQHWRERHMGPAARRSRQGVSPRSVPVSGEERPVLSRRAVGRLHVSALGPRRGLRDVLSERRDPLAGIRQRRGHSPAGVPTAASSTSSRATTT